jgi:DNA modification methylase
LNETVRTIIYKEYFSKENKNKDILPHTQAHGFLKNVVVNTDVLETLKVVSDESMHLTFTSLPYYNARDYSIYPSYQAYLEFLEKIFIETHRATKEGRFNGILNGLSQVNREIIRLEHKKLWLQT